MTKKEFEDGLWPKVSAWQKELDRLRHLAKEKETREEPVQLTTEINVQEVLETLEESLDEAKKRLDGLHEIAEEAWEQRGAEIRRDLEFTFEDLENRFKSLAESMEQK